MRAGLLAVGIAAGVAAGGPALAQMKGAPEIVAKRQMHITASLDILYDTNISHTSEAAAALRGIHPEDEVVTPYAAIDIVQPIGRNAAFLQGNAGYDFHGENHRLNRENIDLTGGGLLSTGPCKTTGYGRFASQQSDLLDTSLAVVSNQTQTATGGGQIACGKQRGLNLQLQGSHTDVVNSETRQKLADHRADDIGVSLGYANERLGQIALVYNYGQAYYPDRLNAKNTFGDSYWNQLLGITITHQFGSKLKVQATGGQSTVKRQSAPPNVPLKQTGFNYAAAVDYKLTNRLEFGLQAARQFQPSNRPGKLYDLITHTEGTAKYQFGTRITLTVGGFVEDLKANTDTAPNALPTITKARRTNEYVTIRYRQSDRLSALLDVRHEDRDTDVALFNYSDTRATLTLATSF